MDYEVDMIVEDNQVGLNETDTEVEAPGHSETQSTQITQSTRATRKRRKTSPVWDAFVSIGVGDDGRERAKCKYCGTQLVIKSERGTSYGTHHLSIHLETCSKAPKKGVRPAYDHKVDREMAAEVIIYHDLPFRYVEYEKVRDRDKYLNPDCQPICRQTAAGDVFKRFEIEKENLKERLANHKGRVCFTSDLWTSRPTVTGYICLTAHFIDASWKLNSVILAFCEMKPPHTGDALAIKILGCLREWGLEKKVFSITLDNAKNNDGMMKILKGQLEMTSGSESALVCEGKFMHIRCCAHVLNLIVKDGLDLVKDLLFNIRESVRYVKASASRIEAFASCATRAGVKSGAGLSLDVQTRWNSTYEMLVRALIFRKAFVNMELYDNNYENLPSEHEWNRGEIMSELLKPFSIITTHFSGSKYPTSNVYFEQVWRIELLLDKYSTCDDAAVKEMALKMKKKFTKYWKHYSMILAIGAVLDPRMKLTMLEKAYERVDFTTSKSKIEELKDNMTLLYEDYHSRSSTTSSFCPARPAPYDIVTESPLDDDFDNDLLELEKSIDDSVSTAKSHLDVYLEEPRLERRLYRDLDVLCYWKENGQRFGALAALATDVLSIPIMTVASESAFSVGGRVLTPYRNRLLPDNVQALLCTRNWLRGFAEYEGTIEDIDDNCNATNSSEVRGSRSEDSSF